MISKIVKFDRNGSILVLICILCLFLRLMCLNKSLSGDEINSALAAKQSVHNIPLFVSENDSYPPLQHVLLHFWMKISDSEVWIRLLYVMFGIGVCLMAYLIGKEYVNSRFGLYAIFLTAISPQLIQLSQYVRGIIISTFFICVSVYFLLRIMKGNSRNVAWFGYLFCSICAVYSFYFSVLVVIAENIYVVLNLRRTKNIIGKWFLAQMLIISAFIPWVPFFIKQVSHANIANNIVATAPKGFFVMGFHVGAFIRGILGTFGLDQMFLFDEALSRILPRLVLMTGAVACFVALLLVVIRSARFFKKCTDISKISPFFFHVLIITTFVLAMTLRHLKNFPVASRYFATPCVFFIVIFLGAVFLFRNKIYKTLCLIILSVFFIMRFPAVYAPIEQWREAVSYMENKASQNDCIVFLEKGKNDYGYYSKASLQYFDVSKYFTRDKKTCDFISIDKENSARLFDLIKSYKHIWVVLTHTKVFGGETGLKNWFLKNSFTLTDNKEFIGVSIIGYQGVTR